MYISKFLLSYLSIKLSREGKPLKKILFIVFGGPNKPSTHYRVLQYLNKLNNNESDFVPKILATPQKPALRNYPRLLRGLIHVLQLIKFYMLICFYCIRWADKIFIQKTILPKFIVKLFIGCRTPFLYDFDDAIYVPFTKTKRIRKTKRKREALSYMIKYAETVIAGNRILQEYAMQFRGDCEVIPTVIDLDLYTTTKDTQSFNFIIGWIGTSQNLVFLERLASPLRALRSEFPQLKLLVICDKPFHLDDFTINKVWGRNTEVHDMLMMDIGIMPLVDDEWSRGKCSFKAIQYMGLGIPTVISPVGMNTEVLQDGISGYLADTEAEWVEKLRNLIVDQSLRKDFSTKGRESVIKHYSLQAWLEKWQQNILS